MKKTKYIIKSTTQFKKDFKLAIKRGLKIGLLEDVSMLTAVQKLFLYGVFYTPKS